MHNEDIWLSQPSEKASYEIFTADKEEQEVKISTLRGAQRHSNQ